MSGVPQPDGYSVASRDSGCCPAFETLRSGGFLDCQDHVLIFGRPGSGKTNLLCALGDQLVRQGRSVCFSTCQLLVQELLRAKRDLRLERLLKALRKYEALIIDDLGYVQQSREEMEVLFTLMSALRRTDNRASRKDRLTRTSRAVAGESSEGRCSGCEHGSTVASTVAAKIQSCYTILREMDAGAPTLPFAGGGDDSETTETRPDGETRTLTNIAPGFEIYGYKGEKLRGFVPTLPGLQFVDHSQMLLGILAVNLDLTLCVFLLDASETNYSGFRGAIDQARQRLRGSDGRDSRRPRHPGRGVPGPRHAQQRNS